MKGYWIAHVNVQDKEGYQTYLDHAPQALAAYNARMLSRGEQVTMLEGDGEPPTRAVIFEFESYDMALACYHSPAYQEARQHRLPYANATVMILQGLPQSE